MSSSGGDLLMAPAKSSSSPPTPAASSAGASSPVIPVNAGSIDWLGHGQGSKADSVSHIGLQPVWASLSTAAGGSSIGYSQASCRPWERNDLLRRLSTFKPSSWSAKPKAASNLACARRGWVNGDVDKIECESCGANLEFVTSASGKSIEGESSGEEFARLLDEGHKTDCPWKGNLCAESLVQFPATSPSALIGGYKDRCDGLLQFPSLPIVASSAIEQMRISGGLQIDHFLVHLQAFTVGESAFKAEVMPHEEKMREEFVCHYTRAQKLISLCGWEPRWLPDVQDFEEHSAQSAKNGHSFGPTKDSCHLHGAPSKSAMSASTKIGPRKHEVMGPKSTCESRSPLLDCSLCGATVRVLDFLNVARPAPIAPSSADIPETVKKIALTHGVSAASGISGWATTNGIEKEQTEDHDEAAITDEGKLLPSAVVDLKMVDLLSSAELHTAGISEHHHDVTLGRDLIMRQPSNSEVGDRAQSYESRGPTHDCHKRNLEGGSTVDRPHVMIRQTDSNVAGTVIDRDGHEGKVVDHFSGGPLKRARDSYAFETHHPSYKRDSSVNGPIQSAAFEISRDYSREYPSCSRNDQCAGVPSTRDSARASSVIAMDTLYHSAENDSMESVDNRPGDMDDVHFPSTPLFRNPEINETSEVNYSNQAQQSVSPAPLRYDGEIGISSTNEGEEVLNTDATTSGARDGPSFEISDRNLGMRASLEDEIHCNDLSVHRVDSVVGDIEPVAEVNENQGQTGECATDPGLMGDFVPHEIVLEYPQGGSQDLVSQSVERADSGFKITGSAKAEFIESGEKTNDVHLLPNENSNHPSLSCNADIFSTCEASKEEVTQVVKPSPTDECGYPRPEYIAANSTGIFANSTGPPNCESNYEEAVEFDPIKHHSYFCPWVNGNVAGAGCGSGSGSTGVSAMPICGWQLTLHALDEFQSLGHVPNQIRESESAASLYKDDHLTTGPKLVRHNSFSRSHERN